MGLNSMKMMKGVAKRLIVTFRANHVTESVSGKFGLGSHCFDMSLAVKPAENP